MTDILISLTICPECGGTRWQRWGVGTHGQWESFSGASARIDWSEDWAYLLSWAVGFDLCAGCGLVIR